MIEIKDLHISLGSIKVLNNLNFTIGDGRIQALLGVNGAGKSTLIRIISGLIHPKKGHILIDNQVLNKSDLVQKRKFGYVFEQPIYIEKFSSKEYLTFLAEMHALPTTYYIDRIKWLLDFFEINEKKYIETYSKGMKSKVSLAASLLHDPKYLVIDEPFDGIDFLMIQKIEALFKDRRTEGKSILITSHQLDLITDICDDFALLNKGRIEFNLPKNELMAKHENYSTGQNLKKYIETILGK